MLYFAIWSVLYISALVLIKPEPSGLKEKPLSYLENFYLVKTSIFSGLFVSFIFLLITNFSFVDIDNNKYAAFALNNNSKSLNLWIQQIFCHNFVHFNILHLLTNVIGLGIASAYERKVGATRFFTVLIISSSISVLSILFYSEPIVISGISGGVFGLAAAFFTDEKNLTTKDWIVSIAIFSTLILMITFQSSLGSDTYENLNLKTDHIGHILGAIGGIVYCRLRPRD